MTFFWLLSAHFIGDFVFQDSFQAEFKANNNYIMFVHSMLWTIAVSFVLNYFGMLEAWKIGFLLFGHFIVDSWKCNHPDKDRALTDLLYMDQAMHLIQLLIVYFVN